MSVEQLMLKLASQHIRMSETNGELSIKAPKGVMTQDLAREIKEYKPKILQFLRNKSTDETAAFEVIPERETLFEPFPFSDLQVAFYMANNPYMEYHVRPHYYNEFKKSEFDIQRYQAAINKALRRHRGDAVMVTENEQLCVLKELPELECKIHDLSALTELAREQAMLAIRARMSRQEIPLDTWPWMDIEICHWTVNGAQQARIHSNFNNFYSDGFGVTVLQREIDAFYLQPDLKLPELELSYRDAVLGLEALAKTPEGLAAKNYWLSRLDDLPEPPPLPRISTVDTRCRSELQRRDYILPAEKWSAVKSTAKKYGLTPSSVIITAYAEILSLWSGTDHFILSNMVTRRLPIHKQIREVVGNFASLYPLEIDLRSEGNFVEKTLVVQNQILSDSDNRQYGGMQVMQAFNQRMGEFGKVPCPFVVGSALFMQGYKKADYSCLETSQTLLDHQFWELEDGGFYCVWDLLEQFFPSGMINQMWKAYLTVLNSLAESESVWTQSPSAIALTYTAFKKALPPKPEIRENENTANSNEQPRLLHEAFENIALERATKTAISVAGRETPYRSLHELSTSIAVELQELGLANNELVALVMYRDEKLIASTIATLSCGAAYLPVDPAYPENRIHYLLENSKAKVVISCEPFVSALSWPNGVTVVNLDKITKAHSDLPKATPQSISALPSNTVSDTDLAYVIYTSGSTGNPKGVMIDHRGALNTVIDINERYSVNAEDTIFGASSFSFDLSVYDVFATLNSGCKLVYPQPSLASNPAHWLQTMETEKVTVWNSAPPLMTLLSETAIRQERQLPHLRLVMLSGDWIPLDLPEKIRRIAPNAKVVSLGGATEASIWSIYYDIEAINPDWSSIPYGKGLKNQSWKIRDHWGREVPEGAIGELHIGGIGLAKGYWADESKTNASFIFDDITKQRLYRTGDLGRFMPDGNIEFLGRKDSQVKIQGYRIELGEIESALQTHHDIDNVIVLAKQQGQNNDGKTRSREKVLAAFIVASSPRQQLVNSKSGESTSDFISDLRQFIGESLPAYMVPTHWVFLEEIPITSNGKIDRKALANLSVDSAASAKPSKTLVSRPARGAVEITLAQVWRDVLDIETITATDDFFDLGGTSFDAVRCLSLIQEELGKALSLGDVWQLRTIEAIAAHLEKDSGQSSGLTKINNRSGQVGLFLIHPGGGQIIGYYPLAEKLEMPVYAISAGFSEVENGILDTIETAASHYVSLIKEEQGTGPYRIAGWSSGGCIVHEIAKQLEALGERVELVTMLDAPAPMQHDIIERKDMMLGFFEDLGLALDVTSTQIDGNTYSDVELFQRFLSIFNEQLNDSATSNVVLNYDQMFPMYRVFEACVNAVRNYKPNPINTKITVIRASEGEVTEFAGHPCGASLDWGWDGFSSMGAEGIMVEGSHHTFLREENVHRVASLINQKIAENVQAHSKGQDERIVEL